MFSWENFEYVLQHYFVDLLKGAGITLLLAIIGTLVGLLLGLILAFFRNLKPTPNDNIFIRIAKWIAKGLSIIYIEFFRGTPMMVQSLIIFFGLTSIGINWPYFAFGALIISINTAAYMAEIVRSGINSIDKGQIEASRSLGMNHLQTMVYVVYPQALKNVIPTIGNEFIVNVKDSSVLNVITVSELFMMGKIAANNTYMYFETYIIISIFYLFMTLIISLILRQIEKRLNKPYTESKSIFKKLTIKEEK